MKNDEIAGVVLDYNDNKKYVFMKNMFINQITRDGPEIAKYILSKYEKEFDIISTKCATVQAFLLSAMISDDTNKTNKNPLYSLLLNVNNSISSMMLLISHGYKIQPMILSRNTIEIISVIAHLCIKPDDRKLFLDDKLTIDKTIGTLKSIIPLVGKIWASYSRIFVHISPLYSEIEQIKKPEENDKTIEIVISSLYLCTWLYYVIAELVSIHLIRIDNLKYWTIRDDSSYFFNIPQSEIEEMEYFFKKFEEI